MAATQSIPEPPEKKQAALDRMAQAPIPTNGRLRVPSYVGAPEAVPIRLLVNGAPNKAFTRSVDKGTIVVTPEPAFPAHANVAIEIGGIPSGRYQVGARADSAAPVIGRMTLERVGLSVPGPVCPPTPSADVLQIAIEVDDESFAFARDVRLLGKNGAPIEAQSFGLERARASYGPFSKRALLYVRFADGTLATAAHPTLRFEIVDIAGNASGPLTIPIDVPPSPSEKSVQDAGTASGAGAVPTAQKRGCL